MSEKNILHVKHSLGGRFDVDLQRDNQSYRQSFRYRHGEESAARAKAVAFRDSINKLPKRDPWAKNATKAFLRLRVPEAQHALLLQLRDTGWTIGEIASRLNVGDDAVCEVINNRDRQRFRQILQ